MQADPLSRPIPARTSRRNGFVLALAILALMSAGAWLWHEREAPPPGASPQAPAQQAPPAPPEAKRAPEIAHPIERAEADVATAAPPIPDLDASDATILAALGKALSASPFERVIVGDAVVRRFVATVDNVPRTTLPLSIRSVRPAPGLPAVDEADGHKSLGAGNPARYVELMQVVDALDARALVALYVRHYPLFQQAYRDLGYPDGYFNDRLVVAIDSLLATPEIDGAIGLSQPRVLYTFADPGLESLPAGQKAMLRLGRDNAARVKAKLREIRALVAR